MMRVKYWAGMVLGADDLTDEQTYFIERLKRHNRLLHGSGIVAGLGVSLRGGRVFVAPGAALDCEGNEIVVESSFEGALPAADAGSQYLTISFEETEADPVPVAAPGGGGVEELSTRVVEGFKLGYEKHDPLAGHPRRGGHRIACNRKHGITLARFQHVGTRWRVRTRP